FRDAWSALAVARQLKFNSVTLSDRFRIEPFDKTGDMTKDVAACPIVRASEAKGAIGKPLNNFRLLHVVHSFVRFVFRGKESPPRFLSGVSMSLASRGFGGVDRPGAKRTTRRNSGCDGRAISVRPFP